MSLAFPKKIARLSRSNVFIFFVFLLLPYVFFTIGTNIFQRAIAPGDGTIQGIPTKIFSAQMHLWNPYVQTGTFALKDIGWQALYLPGIIVMRIFPNAFGYNLLLLAHYSLAGFFTYLFLRKLNLIKTAAFIGGITFMFCGFYTAHKGHHTMLMAASYLPVIFYFFECYVSSKKSTFLLATGLAFGMSILADYTAVPMYIGMLLLPYMICTSVFDSKFALPDSGEARGIPQKLLNRLFLVLKSSFLVFGVGLLIASVQVLPIIESLDYVTRQNITFGFFSSYSFNTRLLPLLIFPFFYGANTPVINTNISYIGPWNLTEMTGYMGILPLFFAGLGIILFWKKNWRIVFWYIAAAFAFLLVNGDSTPFYRLMYHVPVYNMFRVPARNWLEVNFAVAILGSFFINYAISATHGEIKKYLKVVIPALMVFWAAVVAIVLFGYKLGFTNQVDNSLFINSRLSSAAIFVPLLIILVSTILLLILYKFRHTSYIWLLVGIVIFLDLFSFGYYHDRSYPRFGFLENRTNEVAKFLQDTNPDEGQYRILPLLPHQVSFEQQLYPLLNMMYGFNTTNGYGAIWVKEFTDLTKFVAHGASDSPGALLQNSTILSLLSTKYLVISTPEVKAFIERLSFIDQAEDAGEVVVRGVDPETVAAGSVEFKDKSIILKTDIASNLSYIQIPMEIEPNTSYEISVNAKLPEALNSDDFLVVDFYGEGYDSPLQETLIKASALSKDFQTYYFLLNSGPHVPETAFLRFYTFSKIPFELKDIKMRKSGGTNRYWGNADIRPASPYMKRYEMNNGIAVYENMNFLPRARFVEQVEPVKDTSTAIYNLWYNLDFDPSQTAFVEGYTGIESFDPGEVITSDYSNFERVDIKVRTGNRGFLLLSDTYYVGWKAFVDGKEVPIYKTNATSRGIIIDGAGEHSVRFQFVPLSFYIGLALSTLTLLTAGFFVWKWRKQEK